LLSAAYPSININKLKINQSAITSSWFTDKTGISIANPDHFGPDPDPTLEDIPDHGQTFLNRPEVAWQQSEL
jgi:hypothetical protein